jgi:hypothetical protein
VRAWSTSPAQLANLCVKSETGRPSSLVVILKKSVILGGEAPYAEFAIEKQRSDICDRDQILKIAVRAGNALNLQFELLICGLQLLVDRLKLFPASPQLLRGRAVLLADRLHFLVGCAQFLDGGLVFLPAGAKERLRRLQLFRKPLRRAALFRFA